MKTTNSSKDYLVVEHFLYSLSPNIRILDKNRKTIGYIKIRFLMHYKKSIDIQQSLDSPDYLYKLNRFKLPKRSFEYHVLDKNAQELYQMKHIGPHLIIKRNVFELSQNKKIIGYVKENSSNLYMLKHFFLVIPIIGDFFYNLMGFIPKTFILYKINELSTTSQKVAKIKILNNFVSIKLKLELVNKIFDDDILITTATLLELFALA